MCYTQINVQGAVPEKRICATQSPPPHNRNRPFLPSFHSLPPYLSSGWKKFPDRYTTSARIHCAPCPARATHSSDLINYHVVFRATPGGRWWCGARTGAGSWAASSAGASGAPSPTCPASAPASPSSGTGSWPTRPDAINDATVATQHSSRTKPTSERRLIEGCRSRPDPDSNTDTQSVPRAALSVGVNSVGARLCSHSVVSQ